LLSTGNLFRDPWAVTVNIDTNEIYVADSGYDKDRVVNGVLQVVNVPGKIIKVNPITGQQELIAEGAECKIFPANDGPCQNVTSLGSYITHPYGIALDANNNIIVSDMSSFNGKGAIIRIAPNGVQTPLWEPPPGGPQMTQVGPFGCPMGVAVEPTGNILATTFMFPVPSPIPNTPPPGTYYGCSPPGTWRLNLTNNAQEPVSGVSTYAPDWQGSHAYAVGDLVNDSAGNIHKAIQAGVSGGGNPSFNPVRNGNTADGSVLWQNVGSGANWRITFGVDTEPSLTAPSGYNIIVGDEGYSMVFRLDTDGRFVPPVPLAAGVSNVTSVSVIKFTPRGGFKGANVTPVVTSVSASPNPVNENSSTTLTYTFTDDANDNKVEITWGDGSADTVVNLVAPGTYTATHTYTDNGAYTASVKVTDKQNVPSTPNSTIVTVNNVAPAVTINGAPAGSIVGSPIALTSTVSDPSPQDTAAGFTYAWTVERNGSTVATGSAANLSFTPSVVGSYVITLGVTDKDGGTGSASQTVTVSAGLQVQVQDLTVAGSLATFTPAAGTESLSTGSRVVGNFMILNLAVSSHFPGTTTDLARMDLNSALRTATGSGELQILLQYTGLPGDVDPMSITGTATWFVSLGNALVKVQTWAVPDGGSPVPGLTHGPLTSGSFSVTDTDSLMAPASYKLYTQINISALTRNRTASIQSAAIVER
jgi:hypothetical protein